MALNHVELLVIFTMSLNLFSGMLIASGAAADMGLAGQVRVGGDQAVDAVVDNSSEVGTGAPTGSTLFGSYNVLAGQLAEIRRVAYAAPTIFGNLGAPGYITAPLSALITVVYAFGIIKFFRGL
jgi:hypothetical protein